ncbi:MAG: hypothetical protein DWI03_06590 [Planctomycetota bacterium]|nr:MAG: hypothetical protein DWI03_06590 [Planctomycetota bacterium]
MSTVADLVFAFDAALDRPVPVPEGAPPAIAATIARAAADSLDQAVAEARRAGAAALVLCGRVLDPQRASPAQAADLRRIIDSLAAAGCRTVLVADETPACHEFARMLGEPQGLCFVTPLVPVTLDIRGVAVDIVSAHGDTAASLPAARTGPSPLQRRIVVGWDAGARHAGRWSADAAAADATEPVNSAAQFLGWAGASPTWSLPGTLWIWGSRQPQMLPPGVHHLPALQPRSAHEAAVGACCTLTLLDRHDAATAAPHADWRGSWREVPTQRVGWRTLQVESQAGGDEELATAIWSALEGSSAGQQAALELVRCAVACGTSVARRVRVAEIAAETLSRVRQLYDPATFRAWCSEVVADPGESLAPLGHARSGGRPGTTTSFSSALADIVATLEEAPEPTISADVARQAGWLALELIEST